MELKDATNLPLILLYLCPGVVFVWCLNWFTTGRPPSINKDTVGGFIAVSVVYAVATASLGLLPAPLHPSGPTIELALWPERGLVFLYAVAVPYAAGVAWGALTRREVPYRLAKFLRLNPLHPRPTSWETAFSRLKGGEFLILTLKDGACIKGYFDARSSVSTDPSFRDIYLEEMLPVPGQATDVVRGAWVAPGELKLVEIVSPRDPRYHNPDAPPPDADQEEITE